MALQSFVGLVVGLPVRRGPSGPLLPRSGQGSMIARSRFATYSGLGIVGVLTPTVRRVVVLRLATCVLSVFRWLAFPLTSICHINGVIAKGTPVTVQRLCLAIHLPYVRDP